MTSYDRYRCLSVERRGKVLVIWFDRPDALNAIDAELHRELSQIFADVGGDREAQAVVLTGKGRAFSAGGDLRWFQHATRDELDALFAEARKIIVDFLEVEQPIIAAVNGPATGLGATLALFSDVIFASGEARIGDPHVRIGVVAGDGGAIIWPRSRRRDFINVRVVTDPHGGPAEWAKRKGPPVRRTEPTRANPLAAEIVRGTQTHRGNGILA